MPELRRDPVTGRWVIISTDRQKRPHDFQFERAGRGRARAVSVLSGPRGDDAARSAGLPAGRQRAQHARLGAPRRPQQVSGAAGGGDDGRSRGRRDVRPHERHRRARGDHRDARITIGRWRCSPRPRSSACCGRARERMLDLKRDFRLKYILVFKNHGAAAGATLEHPHAQLIALPIVPDFVRDEIDGGAAALRGQGALRLLRHRAAGAARRAAGDSGERGGGGDRAVRAALRVRDLDAARRHGARFEEAPRQDYEAVARLLKAVLQRMNRALETPPFNLVLHSAPFVEEAVGGLSLAHRDHAEADAGGRVRVGNRVLHQPDAAGGGGAGAARGQPVDLKADPAVWYFGGSGGNSSVVECDLAKVEVAGSNPVSRSNIFFSPGRSGRVARPAIRLLRGAVAKR